MQVARDKILAQVYLIRVLTEQKGLQTYHGFLL